MQNLNVFVAYHSKDLEDKKKQVLISNLPDELSKLTQRVGAAADLLRSWVQSHGGRALSSGDGNGVLEVSAEYLSELKEIVDRYGEMLETAVAVGVGKTTEEASRALDAAKEDGKTSIRLWSNDTNLTSAPEEQQEIKKAETNNHGALVSKFNELSAKSQQVKGESDKRSQLKSKIAETIKEFRALAPLWEQLKQSQPDAYKTLTDVVQSMIQMAQALYSENNVKKAEFFSKTEFAPKLHSSVEGFMEQLKGLPSGPARRKFIVAHAHHAPFLSALEAHPQGPQIRSMIEDFVGKVEKKDLMPGGKGDNKKDSDFDSKQLESGTKQESEEHGLDPRRAKEIAKDHLTEDPKYYD